MPPKAGRTSTAKAKPKGNVPDRKSPRPHQKEPMSSQDPPSAENPPMYSAQCAKRLLGEAENRSPYWRDYGRILYSPAFRRLQNKTQVYPTGERDFVRNRLTHSLEVAQIGVSIVRRLNADLKQRYDKDTETYDKYKIEEDIVAAAALAHDIGHPPFGHQGERTLNQSLLKNPDSEGFEGNAQTFRILTKLEHKIPGRGLNLTHRTLLGTVKYYGTTAGGSKGYYKDDWALICQMYESVTGQVCVDMTGKSEEEKKSQQLVEAQIMDLADDIAYCSHDIEDAIKAGYLQIWDLVYPPQGLLQKLEVEENLLCGLGLNLFGLDNNGNPQIIKSQIDDILANNENARGKVVSRIITRYVEAISLDLNKATPMCSRITLKPDLKGELALLKKWYTITIIGHPVVLQADARGAILTKELFKLLQSDRGKKLIPKDFVCGEVEERTICDFVASLSDLYAAELLERLRGTSPPPSLVF